MTVLSQEIEEQANDLLGGRMDVLNPMRVQQQRNGSDCGVFATAFSNCLVFGKDPTFVNVDILRMRSHLAACLRNGRISFILNAEALQILFCHFKGGKNENCIRHVFLYTIKLIFIVSSNT